MKLGNYYLASWLLSFASRQFSRVPYTNYKEETGVVLDSGGEQCLCRLRRLAHDGVGVHPARAPSRRGSRLSRWWSRRVSTAHLVRVGGVACARRAATHAQWRPVVALRRACAAECSRVRVRAPVSGAGRPAILPRQCPGLAVAGAAGSGSSGGAMGGIWESSISKSTRTRNGASERAWVQPSGDPGSAAPATLARLGVRAAGAADEAVRE